MNGVIDLDNRVLGAIILGVFVLSAFTLVPSVRAQPIVVGPSILVYSDDAFNLGSTRGPNLALDNLGYMFTYYSDGSFGAFETALEGGGWDLVIFNDENYTPTKSVIDALNVYVQSGGKLILCTWSMASYVDHPLWTTMGVSYSSPDYSGIWTLYPWETFHPVLNDPNSLTTMLYYNYSGHYRTYGYYVNALPGATAVVGATPSPSSGNAIIAVNSANTTVFNGLLTGIMSSDYDGDGKRDDVELYENEITFLLNGAYTPVGFKGEGTYSPNPAYALTGGFPYSSFVDVVGSRYNEYALGSENAGPTFYKLDVLSRRTFLDAQLLLAEDDASIVYPSHQALPEGITPYKYAKLILGVPSSALEEVVVYFKVSKAWLSAEGIDATDVKLYRFVSGWVAQPTSILSENDDFVLFTATPDGLKYLAIGG